MSPNGLLPQKKFLCPAATKNLSLRLFNGRRSLIISVNTASRPLGSSGLAGSCRSPLDGGKGPVYPYAMVLEYATGEFGPEAVQDFPPLEAPYAAVRKVQGELMWCVSNAFWGAMDCKQVPGRGGNRARSSRCNR